MFIEKRASPRITITCKISLSSGEKQEVLNCHTENLSTDGIMVILGEKIAPSTEVDLELLLWDKESPLRCKGQIAWFNEISPKETKPRLFKTGIEFTQISDADKKEVGEFIHDILTGW